MPSATKWTIVASSAAAKSRSKVIIVAVGGMHPTTTTGTRDFPFFFIVSGGRRWGMHLFRFLVGWLNVVADKTAPSVGCPRWFPSHLQYKLLYCL